MLFWSALPLKKNRRSEHAQTLVMDHSSKMGNLLIG